MAPQFDLADYGQLQQLMQDCLLQSANSANPRSVWVDHFVKAFQLGQQVGIRQATEALDMAAHRGQP